ncbi:hypothetical protein HPB50_025333 [Hyalomma asiaticum]|uniref:Uncharacterized protein n=1 Tax=Hyalomma asiaticum TaxID=266040 RepID=A0ACB7ST10_HYAAI|nr:hypothetical protein HPB50_025333 [Hyalomma asiaticum]
MKHLSCVEFAALAEEHQCFYGIDNFKEEAIPWYEMWCKKTGDPSEITCCELLRLAKTFFPGVAKAIEVVRASLSSARSSSGGIVDKVDAYNSGYGRVLRSEKNKKKKKTQVVRRSIQLLRTKGAVLLSSVPTSASVSRQGGKLRSLAGRIRCRSCVPRVPLVQMSKCATDGTLIAATFVALFVQDAKHLFCILLMTCLWILDTLPVAVTASLPLVVQPLLGIADCDQVAFWFMSPRFVWLLCLHLAISLVDTSSLTLMAASRVVELFGGSFRSLLAVIVLFTFEMTLFLDEALCLLLLWPLAEAVVRHMQFFQGSPITTAARAGFATEDVPGTPGSLKGQNRNTASERLGTRVHVQPNIPESSSYSTTNLARYVFTQQTSQAATSSLEMAESATHAHAAIPSSDHSTAVEAKDTKDDARESPQAECNRAIPINSSRMEAIFRMWDANAAKAAAQHPPSHPYLSSSDIESSTSFVVSRTCMVPVLNPDKPAKAGEPGSPSVPEAVSTHSVAEDLLTSINEKLFRMKMGLKISIAYASTFGSFGTPYGTSLALAAQAYFKEHLRSIGVGQWIVLCLPIAALTVTACTCLIFWLFMGEWELEEVGLELASFLKNVVELKLSEDRCREICVLMVVSAAIVLTGIGFGALITFFDVETTQINCTTYVLLLVLGVSAVSQIRIARGSTCGGATGGAAQMCSGGAAVAASRNSSLGLEAGLLNVPWGMLFLLGGHECLGKAAQARASTHRRH